MIKFQVFVLLGSVTTNLHEFGVFVKKKKNANLIIRFSNNKLLNNIILLKSYTRCYFTQIIKTPLN